MVRRPDNLRPEGDFPDRPQDQASKGERAPVVRRPDNLVMEGEFIGMSLQRIPLLLSTWIPIFHPLTHHTEIKVGRFSCNSGIPVVILCGLFQLTIH